MAACRQLRSAGCPVVYLDGSFVTAKPQPRDYDMCWDGRGVKAALLDPLFIKSDSRRAVKSKYLGDILPLPHPQGGTYLDFFQLDRDGEPKGIVAIRLVDDPSLEALVR